MKENTKKTMSLIYKIVLLLLAAVFTYFSVMPAMTIDSNRLGVPSDYTEGRFTSDAQAPGDIDIGFGTIISAVTNWSDFTTVIGIQSTDKDIENKEKSIAEMEDAERAAKATEDLEKMVKNRDERLEKLKEADLKRIADKLENDEGFIQLLGAYYCLTGTFASETEAAVEGSSSDDLGIKTLDITITILSVAFLVILIGTALVFSVIIVIKFIVLLIKTLVTIKDADDQATDKRMDKFPFTSYTGVMLIFFMLYSLVSTGVEMGAAVKGAMAVLVVVCIVRAVKTFIYAEKDRVLMLVKQAITAVSIVAAAVLLFNFIGTDMINEYDSVIYDMSNKQYAAELDKLESADDTDKAEEAVSSANGRNTAIIVGVSLVGAMMLIVALVNGIERFGNKLMKLKTGELVPYKAMVVMAVFLLIIAVVPTLFSTGSAKDRDKAFESGTFKIWYTEFEEKGTVANTEYKQLLDSVKDAEKEVKDLRKEVDSADKKEVEELSKELAQAESALESLNREVKDVEASGSRPIMCIVAAVVFLLSEIAYLVVPKILSKKENA